MTSGSVALHATGAIAAGFEAEQTTRGDDGAERGLSALRCPTPTTSSWFVGAATTVGAGASLQLVNVEQNDALVDISFLAPDGALEPSAGQGLRVPARSRLVVALDTLVPDVEWLAVHVTSRSGRVASALLQSRGAADAPGGIDWVPAAGDPTSRIVVPGVPDSAGKYTLLVANPAQSPTTVSVQTATADGVFVPSGLEAIEVPAQSVTAVDVTQVLSDAPSTLQVRSEAGPVLASVALRYSDADSELAEIAYVGAAQPLTTQAAVTDVSNAEATTNRLLVTSLDAASTVVVTPLPVAGATEETLPARRRFQVPAGRTAELDLGAIAGSADALPVRVSVSPGGGRVYASRVVSESGGRGPLVTVLTVESPPVSVPLPSVVRAPEVTHPR